jgi:hypothetical protein
MAHKLVILGVEAVSAVVGGGESMKATLGFAGVLRGVVGGVAAMVKSKGEMPAERSKSYYYSKK